MQTFPTRDGCHALNDDVLGYWTEATHHSGLLPRQQGCLRPWGPRRAPQSLARRQPRLTWHSVPGSGCAGSAAAAAWPPSVPAQHAASAATSPAALHVHQASGSTLPALCSHVRAGCSSKTWRKKGASAEASVMCPRQFSGTRLHCICCVLLPGTPALASILASESGGEILNPCAPLCSRQSTGGGSCSPCKQHVWLVWSLQTAALLPPHTWQPTSRMTQGHA